MNLSLPARIPGRHPHKPYALTQLLWDLIGCQGWVLARLPSGQCGVHVGLFSGAPPPLPSYTPHVVCITCLATPDQK